MSDRGVHDDEAPVRAAPTASPPTCECGHPEAVHRHYRRGTDCGVCGVRSCPRFRRRGSAGTWVRRLLRGGR